MNEDKLKKVIDLFENMTASIIQLQEKTTEQDKKIQYLETQLLKSLDLNSNAIETVINRFQTPIEDFNSRIAELEALISSSTQVFALLKETDIIPKINLVDKIFDFLIDLPLINLKILSIFNELQHKILDNSI